MSFIHGGIMGLDDGQIEVADDRVAEILRRKKRPGTAQNGLGFLDFLLSEIQTYLRNFHPD